MTDIPLETLKDLHDQFHILKGKIRSDIKDVDRKEAGLKEAIGHIDVDLEKLVKLKGDCRILQNYNIASVIRKGSYQHHLSLEHELIAFENKFDNFKELSGNQLFKVMSDLNELKYNVIFQICTGLIEQLGLDYVSQPILPDLCSREVVEFMRLCHTFQTIGSTLKKLEYTLEEKETVVERMQREVNVNSTYSS